MRIYFWMVGWHRVQRHSLSSAITIVAVGKLFVWILTFPVISVLKLLEYREYLVQVLFCDQLDGIIQITEWYYSLVVAESEFDWAWCRDSMWFSRFSPQFGVPPRNICPTIRFCGFYRHSWQILGVSVEHYSVIRIGDRMQDSCSNRVSGKRRWLSVRFRCSSSAFQAPLKCGSGTDHSLSLIG